MQIKIIYAEIIANYKSIEIKQANKETNSLTYAQEFNTFNTLRSLGIRN